MKLALFFVALSSEALALFLTELLEKTAQSARYE